MPEHVRITDVSPRDGLQNEPGVVPTADKVRLIESLAASGVDEIEATSFVSPKWVPQLGDAVDVLTALHGSDLFLLHPESARSVGSHSEPSPHGRGQGEGSDEFPGGQPLHQQSPGVTDRARGLRRGMTEPEQRLWRRLRGDQLSGVRFRRQHPIGPYIADVYCPSHRLVIEIDGRTHELMERRRSDAQRDAWMTERGIRVLRFSNDQVMRELEGVVRSIWRIVRESPSPPAPLPEGEGGRSDATRGRIRPVVSVLVPNAKGFERALGFQSAEFPLKIAVFTAASETFNKKNTNATIAESIERFRAFVPRALDAGMMVRLYVSCAIACPYEGKIEPAQVRRVCDELVGVLPGGALERGVAEIDLGDTIGAATPKDITSLLSIFDDAERSSLVLHLHDTHGRAADCVRAALDTGVRSFDGSVAGLGGCPYAGTKEKPAPGNISTGLLTRTINDAGFATGVDLDALGRAAELARRIVGKARASAV